MQFLGTFTPRLDDKGRMFLPAKFREKLAGGLVMTRGQERCLYIYTAADFAEHVSALPSGLTTTANVRAFQRMLLSGASDEIPDRQGRVTVPAILRDYAGLTHECTVIGTGDRVEVWDTTAWEDYSRAQEEAFASQSEQLGDLAQFGFGQPGVGQPGPAGGGATS